ncbi:hypothetical protein F5878DRAFT_576435 [Lentinula raphanica]|uniref:Uncharacterized protein n=1 Tax=Lentinula raphanica TaxID=153919 RepID=A0AA38PGQ6_9AGAR|nr:hypothetical protein F5880DRAFT_1557175 [Lentinula raphanica]KAJ3842632.1 hypothetical protein F5878DRAFT_576435 [Lentinula raphanica]
MDTITPAGWSSIRPWIPPLSLSVREITSVSVTFILSATSSDPGSETDLSLAGLGLSSEDLHEDEDGPDDEDTSASESEVKKALSVVNSALNGGLSVEVDRSSWRRVYIRIDEKADEAVIIVYGLLPGRQYEIVLELVQAGQMNSIRQQVTTEEHDGKDLPHAPDDPAARSTATLASVDSTGVNISSQPSTPPDSANSTLSSSSSGYGFAPLTLEDRVNQLQHILSDLNTEQATLTATMKASRRDAQKADANLRSEIDVLKRASERYVSLEQRSKQKLLALQEAVKRAQVTSKEMEAKMAEVNGEIPGLEKEKRKREAEHKKVKEVANKVRKAKEEQEEQERKRVEIMKTELGTLTKQLEKLDMKKDKLENGTVKELEEELENIEREMERLQREEQAELSNEPVTQPSNPPFVGNNWAPPGLAPRNHIQDEAPMSYDPGTIGRPSPNMSMLSNPSALQQRPHGIGHTPNSLSMSNAHWTSISTRQPQHNQQQQQIPSHINQRSSSLPQPNLQGNIPYPHHAPHHSQQSQHHHHSHSHSHSHSHQHPNTHHTLPPRPHPPNPTTILMNPNRQSLKNNLGGSGGGSSSSTLDSLEHLSSNSSPPPGLGYTSSSGVSTPSTTGSTLSSRAPPFEPGRGIVRHSRSRSRVGV